MILPEEDHAKWLGEVEDRPDADLGNQSESEFTGESDSWRYKRLETCRVSKAIPEGIVYLLTNDVFGRFIGA